MDMLISSKRKDKKNRPKRQQKGSELNDGKTDLNNSLKTDIPFCLL